MRKLFHDFNIPSIPMSYRDFADGVSVAQISPSEKRASLKGTPFTFVFKDAPGKDTAWLYEIFARLTIITPLP